MPGQKENFSRFTKKWDSGNDTEVERQKLENDRGQFERVLTQKNTGQ